MPAVSDLQILNAQLQSVLDVAHKMFSEGQVQILERELQKTMGITVAESSCSRRPKADRCDGTNCDPVSSSIKTRIQVSESEIPAALVAAKFMCETCSKWVTLRDEKGFTLAPWLAHLLVCGQSKLMILPDDGTSHDNPMPEDVLQGQSPQSLPSPAISSTLNVPAFSKSALARSLTLSSSKTQSSTEASERQPDDTASPGTLFIAKNDKASGALDIQTASITTRHSDTIAKRRRRSNRTEAERVEEFLTDPNVAKVEPYRVLCAVCDKWIKLRQNSRYCPIPWNCHKGSCEKACTRKRGVSSSGAQVAKLRGIPGDAIQGALPSLTAPQSKVPESPLSLSHHADRTLSPRSVHDSLQSHASILAGTGSAPANNNSDEPHNKPRQPRRTRLAGAEQRRAILEADPHSEIVERDRILCALCKKWVKLRPNSSYCSAPWQSHSKRCVAKNRRHGSGSSTVVSKLTAHALAEPLNDTQMTAVDDVAMNPEQEGSRSGYYRKNYNNTGGPSSDERKRDTRSYYKISLAPSSTSGTPLGKYRGRPPKNRTLTSKADRAIDESDSEMSYESEEV